MNVEFYFKVSIDVFSFSMKITIYYYIFAFVGKCGEKSDN